MEKIVGQPCPYCQTPYIEGKNGAYCKPCYIRWKESQENQLGEKNYDKVIEDMRSWSKGVQAKLNLLEERVSKLEKKYEEEIPIINMP